MTEYLYDRDNPKSHFRQRISGIQGLFYGVPNINERADMIGRYSTLAIITVCLTLSYLIRALAKETDGDFAKFVQTTRKPRDMAQKWRSFKNIARFYKNPFAYVFWKI